jgi:hypothetical protein
MTITRSLSWEVRLGLALLMGSVSSCSRNETKTVFTDTDKSEFKVGQVWKYKTRPGEEASTLVILKVETAPGWSTVVHVGVVGVKIASPQGIKDNISHLPFDEAAVKASVTSKISDNGKLTDFHEGYDLWREDKGGVFTVSVAEAVSFVEKALNTSQVK